MPDARSRLAAAAAVVLLAAGAPARAQMSHDAMPGMHHGAVPGTADAAEDPIGASMHAAMRRMEAAMNRPPAGDPDVDFARQMIPHHEGAVDMARAVLASGKDPAIENLAREIIASQEREIAILRDWLAKHGG